MSHPDAIVIEIEDSVSVSVTTPDSPGSISVQNDTPDTIEINTNTGAVTLGELVSGDPVEGSIVVYDADTQSFIFVDSSTLISGGNFSSNLEVTNFGPAIGDAAGESYTDADTIESAVRDILNPSNASIKSVLPCWDYNLNPGYKVPIGRGYPISSAYLEAHRPWATTNNSLTVSVDGNQIGTASSAYGIGSKKSFYDIAGSGHEIVETHGTSKVIKFSNDLSGYEYSDMIYYGRPCFLSFSSDSWPMESEAAWANGITTAAVSFDVPDSEQYSGHDVFLKGTTETESSENYAYFAVPAALRVDSIAEVTASAGVSDRTHSFETNDELYTVIFGSVSYDVYLHRSTQKGSLAEGSTLKIRLKTD